MPYIVIIIVGIIIIIIIIIKGINLDLDTWIVPGQIPIGKPPLLQLLVYAALYLTNTSRYSYYYVCTVYRIYVYHTFGIL